MGRKVVDVARDRHGSFAREDYVMDDSGPGRRFYVETIPQARFSMAFRSGSME